MVDRMGGPQHFMVLQLKDGSKVMLLGRYRSENGKSAIALSGRAFTGHG